MAAIVPPLGAGADGPRGIPSEARLVQRLKKLIRPSTGAMYDQVVQSGCNFLALLLLARLLSKDVFASFALAVAIWQVASGFHRSLIVLPFIVQHSTGGGKVPATQWTYPSLALIAIITALLLAGWGVSAETDLWPWLAPALELAVLIVPGMLIYEFARRLMYQMDRFLDASVMSTILGAFSLAGIGGAYLSGGSALLAAAGMGTGALVGACYGHARVIHETGRPRRDAFVEWLEQAPRTGWHLLSYLAHATYTTALPLIVAGLSTPAVVATFSVTRNLVTPAFVASTAIDSVDKPRAGRAFAKDGLPGLSRALGRTRLMLLALTLPFVLLVCVFSQQILHLFYGDKYLGTQLTIILWAVFVVLMTLNQPEETRLIIIQKTQALFWAKLAGCAVALALAPVLIPMFGVDGAVAIGIISIGINLLIVMGVSR